MTKLLLEQSGLMPYLNTLFLLLICHARHQRNMAYRVELQSKHSTFGRIFVVAFTNIIIDDVRSIYETTISGRLA